MINKTVGQNQGIVMSGGSITANDIAVGKNASIHKETFAELPLTSVPSLISKDRSQFADKNTTQYDVFISHASEDKSEIVRPLATSLHDKGISAWFDEHEMQIGDSIRQKIDAGLATSLLGVVVLSPAFLTKGWTNYELDGIMTRAITGEQILLPIWHNITKQEIVNFSPSLTDKVARSTSTHTIVEIAEEIASLIHQRQNCTQQN